jgi:hypothetical protein
VKTAFGYDGWAQSCGEEVCKTLVAGKGYGDRCDSIPKVLVRAFNFELFASPPPETVDALCACRAGDWMLVQRSQGYRAGSFGQFVADGAAGTLDCGHMAGVGNGTPCLVLCRVTNSNGEDVAPTLTCELARQTTKQLEASGGYVLCPPPCICRAIGFSDSKSADSRGLGDRLEEFPTLLRDRQAAVCVYAKPTTSSCSTWGRTKYAGRSRDARRGRSS